ncbi:MAG: hypothetical protein Q7S83_02205 [bacterium]|nr:hypothetical protein [bacterium]
MSEAPQDGSKYVDQPDYVELCTEKQRRIDELEGMLEQRNGWLRNAFMKVVGVAMYPFRKPLAKLKAVGTHPATLISTGVFALAFSIWYFGEFGEFFRARRGPELTLRQMLDYDGYRVKRVKLFQLVDPRESVAQLISPDGDDVYVRVPFEVWERMAYWDRVDLEKVECGYQEAERNRRERKAIVDRIRRENTPAEDSTNK